MHPDTEFIYPLRCRPRTALLILAFLHFLVDFYGGLLTPLPQPTLTAHLHTDLGYITLLIGSAALLANLVQPLSGWLLPPKGLPWLLLVTPLIAACAALIGLTSSFVLTAVLLCLSGIGIGLLHPEGSLAAHSLGGRHAGAAVGLFMSIGYFGFAMGGMAGGIWAEAWQLRRFWILALPALLGTGLAAWAGLHQLKGHVDTDEVNEDHFVSYAPIFGLAVFTATTMCLLIRFLTILLVRRFPDSAPQAWGGASIFATGVTGALGACLWGLFSDRYGPPRLLLGLNLAALPFLALLLSARQIFWVPVWCLCLGLTIGSSFPLVVIQARKARGLTQRLRMGLTIGGGWGIGEVVFMSGGAYLNRFPADDPKPVVHILSACGLMMVLNIALLLQQRTSGSRATASAPVGVQFSA